jgi:hypothetical protein
MFISALVSSSDFRDKGFWEKRSIILAVFFINRNENRIEKVRGDRAIVFENVLDTKIYFYTIASLIAKKCTIFTRTDLTFLGLFSIQLTV